MASEIVADSEEELPKVELPEDVEEASDDQQEILPDTPGKRSLEAEKASRIREHQERVRNKKARANRITQHVPSFVSIDDPPRTAEFRSIGELLAIPWVAQWQEDIKQPGKRYSFYRFSLCDGNKLMAEYEDGYHWWVVGFVDAPVELPAWEARHRGTPSPDNSVDPS